MKIPASAQTIIKDAVKAAGIVLVVLGAIPAIAQALGVAHIVVPASVLAFASTATLVIAGALSWLKAHGVTAKSVASRVAHRVR